MLLDLVKKTANPDLIEEHKQRLEETLEKIQDVKHFNGQPSSSPDRAVALEKSPSEPSSPTQEVPNPGANVPAMQPNSKIGGSPHRTPTGSPATSPLGKRNSKLKQLPATAPSTATPLATAPPSGAGERRQEKPATDTARPSNAVSGAETNADGTSRTKQKKTLLDPKSPGSPSRKRSPKKRGSRRKDASALQLARQTRWEAEAAAAETQITVTQLKQIQKIRRDQATKQAALTAKHDAENAKQLAKDSKEYEALVRAHEKDLEKVLSKFRTSLDQLTKEDASEAKRFAKRIKEWRDKESAECARELKASLNQTLHAHKVDAKDMSKEEKKSTLLSLNEMHESTRQVTERELANRLDAESRQRELGFKLERLSLRHKLEAAQLREEVEITAQQNRAKSDLKAAKHSAYATALTAQLEERSEAIRKYQQVLVETELEQATSIAREAARKLDKRQNSELKLVPKAIKHRESQIKKDFNGTLKATEQKYRRTLRSLHSTLSELPEATRKDSIRKHETEKTSEMNKLKLQHKTSVTDMIRGETDAMSTRQEEERAELAAQSAQSEEDLRSYQSVRAKAQAQQCKVASFQLKKLIKTREKELKADFAALAELNAASKRRVAELAKRHATEVSRTKETLITST